MPAAGSDEILNNLARRFCFFLSQLVSVKSLSNSMKKIIEDILDRWTVAGAGGDGGGGSAQMCELYQEVPRVLRSGMMEVVDKGEVVDSGVFIYDISTDDL